MPQTRENCGSQSQQQQNHPSPRRDSFGKEQSSSRQDARQEHDERLGD